MNKYIYIAAAMVPSVCMVSCSDPRESAQAAADDFLDGLAEIFQDCEGDSIQDVISDVHSYVESEVDDLLDELDDLNESERRAVLQGMIKSQSMRNCIKRAAQAAIAHVIDDKELIHDFIAAAEARDDKKLFDTLEKHLPYETRMEAIEIGMAFVKIGYALGLDQDDAMQTIAHALMEVAMEYGIPMDELSDAFGIKTEPASKAPAFETVPNSQSQPYGTPFSSYN